MAPADGYYTERKTVIASEGDNDTMIRKMTKAKLPTETKTIRVQPIKHKLPNRKSQHVVYDFEDLL